MIGQVIEMAADLADGGQPTVDRALVRYEQAGGPLGAREAQLWVSVAFLLARHAVMAAMLPD